MKQALTFHFLAILLITSAAWGQVSSRVTLAITDDPAPDGNGTLSDFGIPTLNANGEVALVIGLTGTQNPSTDAIGIYLVDTQSITQLVRTGEPAPDANGVFNSFAYDFGFVERVAVNDNGSVAFTAKLTGTAGGSSDNVGLFGASAMDGVTQYVRLSDPAPDGNGIFGVDSSSIAVALSAPGLDNQGRASFHGLLTSTSGGGMVDDSGIFRADGTTVTKLLRIGQPEPFGTDPVEIIVPAFGSNSVGQVAMEANIGFDFMPGGGIFPEDLERIYIANEVLLEEAFRSGGTPPDGDGIIPSSMMWRTRIADNGNITFLAPVTNTASPLDVGPRLFQTDGVTLTEIVRWGDLRESGNPPFDFTTFVGLDSNSHDQVAFSGTLERNAAPPDNRTSAIYRWNGSNIALLLHQGDPAPGGNGTFGDVAVPLFLNNGGQIAFSASLEGTNDPLNDTRGIFLIDSAGIVHEVARFGQELAESTILFASFLGDLVPFALDDSDLTLAGMDAINDSGQVAFIALLADTRAGVFLWGSTDIFAGAFEGGDTSDWSGSSP